MQIIWNPVIKNIEAVQDTIVVHPADPQFIVTNTVGTAVGNGTSTSMTALAKGTGGGPASLVVKAWVSVDIYGVTYWMPLFQ